MSSRFVHRFRVRYAEVDMQGVVFNSRYLEYADLVLTEYWREIGLHFAGEDAFEFQVVKALVEFRAPMRADEWIDGHIWTERVGTSSVTTRIELHGADREDDLRTEIELVHVHVDLDEGKALPVPDRARAKLEASP